MAIDMKATGKRIKNLIAGQGISPKDISEKTGVVTVQAIYKWLRGENIPSVDNLILLKELLGLDCIDEIVVTTEKEASNGNDK